MIGRDGLEPSSKTRHAGRGRDLECLQMRAEDLVHVAIALAVPHSLQRLRQGPRGRHKRRGEKYRDPHVSLSFRLR
jgi:hypothetical protein